MPGFVLRSLAVLLFLGSALCGHEEVRGLIEEVPFARLSGRTLPLQGQQALAIRGEDGWKHGESEHFVLHFSTRSAGTQVAVEAEFYYRIITRELAIEPPAAVEKSHLFIFETAEEWETFLHSVRLEEWTGAATIDGAIFLPRNMKYRFKGASLGHEMAHLLIRRYLGKGMPLWLEEGYAEDVSQRGYAAFYRARGYAAKPQALEMRGYIPLGELVEYQTYPPADKVTSFYRQSRRLAGFLNGFGDKQHFVKLVRLTAEGKPFSSALRDAYGPRWFSLDNLEADFRKHLETP